MKALNKKPRNSWKDAAMRHWGLFDLSASLTVAITSSLLPIGKHNDNPALYGGVLVVRL